MPDKAPAATIASSAVPGQVSTSNISSASRSSFSASLVVICEPTSFAEYPCIIGLFFSMYILQGRTIIADFLDGTYNESLQRPDSFGRIFWIGSLFKD